MSKLAVYFRMFPEGDVIALFPEVINYPDGCCESYQHVGQHGAASPDLLSELREATPDEYSDLLSELKSIYKPKRVTRSAVLGDAVIFWGVQDE